MTPESLREMGEVFHRTHSALLVFHKDVQAENAHIL